MKKYLVCLEGESRNENKLSGEPTFFRELWSLTDASVEFCDSCGNKSMLSKLMTALNKKSYDAIYINYDTINTYVTENCFAIFQDLRSYCLQLSTPCYILKTPSFESLLLQSDVIADLIACTKNNKYTDLITDIRKIYLKCLAEGDFISICRYRTANEAFNKIWFANVNAEKCISSFISQVTAKHSKLWHCAKGAIGACWLQSCIEIQACNYACQKSIRGSEFHTCLCDKLKLESLLTSLNIHSVEQLYKPFNAASQKQQSDSTKPTNLFT